MRKHESSLFLHNIHVGRGFWGLFNISPPAALLFYNCCRYTVYSDIIVGLWACHLFDPLHIYQTYRPSSKRRENRTVYCSIYRQERDFYCRRSECLNATIVLIVSPGELFHLFTSELEVTCRLTIARKKIEAFINTLDQRKHFFTSWTKWHHSPDRVTFWRTFPVLSIRGVTTREVER